MNSSELRHPAYKNLRHPINFNFGIIHGGDWASSVPSFCQFDVRVGFFPGVSIEQIKKDVEECVAKAAEGSSPPIRYTLSYRGFQAEGTPDAGCSPPTSTAHPCFLGCELDVGSDALKLLARVHKEVRAQDVPVTPITATTDARFFQLYRGIPTTCYGPEARSIHGIDESVSLASMKDVAKVFAAFISDWCGLEKTSA